MDVAEDNEFGVSGSGDYEDKTVERLLSKNSNGAIGYLTPNAR